MRYIFEKGDYPDQQIIDDCVLASPTEAVDHAKEIEADYAWVCPVDGNPSTIYCRLKTEALLCDVEDCESLPTICAEHRLAELNHERQEHKDLKKALFHLVTRWERLAKDAASFSSVDAICDLRAILNDD